MKREQGVNEPLPEEAWWAVLSALRTTLPITPNETTGMGDSDFWVEIEDNAGTMKPKEACMEFYVRGVKHRQLAEFVLFSFQAMRSASKNGPAMDKEQKRILADRIATRLLEYYPPKYRMKFEK